MTTKEEVRGVACGAGTSLDDDTGLTKYIYSQLERGWSGGIETLPYEVLVCLEKSYRLCF